MTLTADYPVNHRTITVAIEPAWMANYDVMPGVLYCDQHYALPLVTCAIYLLCVRYGPRVMKDRAGYDLKASLVAWNAFLAVFSCAGSVYTLPHLIAALWEAGVVKALSVRPEETWGLGGPGFWVQMFIWSKFGELVDTAFLVLRKRPVSFLHWYHHFSVLLYCWHSYGSRAPQTLVFVVMNYMVHSVMYGYYALAALKAVPRWFPTHLITAAQIAQMVVGVAVQSITTYLLATDSPQSRNLTLANLVAGGVMYFTYFALFCDFALKRYVFKKPKTDKKTPEPEPQATKAVQSSSGGKGESLRLRTGPNGNSSPAA
jgi:hypothetical protein